MKINNIKLMTYHPESGTGNCGKTIEFRQPRVRGDLDVAPKQSHITLKRTPSDEPNAQLIVDHILGESFR